MLAPPSGVPWPSTSPGESGAGRSGASSRSAPWTPRRSSSSTAASRSFSPGRPRPSRPSCGTMPRTLMRSRCAPSPWRCTGGWPATSGRPGTGCTGSSVQAREVRGDDDASAVLELAAARLMRARLGDEALADAVRRRRGVTGAPRVRDTSDSPLLPVVKLHLGAAQLQLGRLVDADRNLTEAMNFGRSSGLTALSAEATSELALSQYLQGREHACLELAMDVLGAGRPAVVRPHDAGRTGPGAQAGPPPVGGGRQARRHPRLGGRDRAAGPVARDRRRVDRARPGC